MLMDVLALSLNNLSRSDLDTVDQRIEAKNGLELLSGGVQWIAMWL